jgi:hypothetical protein
MKVFAVLGLLISTVACGSAEVSKHQFMQDNDLWMQDCISCEANTMTEELFDSIIQAGMDVYTPIAKENNETIIINGKWTDSTVNANCLRSGKKVTINQFGGLARREEVNAEGFAIVMCHELGHAYGGAPYVQVSNKMAAEGQSDLYSTKDCFGKIQALVPALQVKKEDYSPYVLNKCTEVFGADNIRCLNGLSGSQTLGNLLATLMKEKLPDFETPDATIVSKTNVSYPKTTQCRLDTYHAGIFDLERPKCWFFQ